MGIDASHPPQMFTKTLFIYQGATTMKKSGMLTAMLILAPTAYAADGAAGGNGVLISGFADVQFGSIHIGDASNGAKGITLNRVDSNSSNIRFSGKEDLGDGLKAIWQLESGVRWDDASSGAFASRNSNVGLAGGFGTVFLGLWDTPYKIGNYGQDPFTGDNIAAYTAIISNGSFTGANPLQTAAAQDSGRFSFSRREANILQYWSPSINGFTFRSGYGAGEEKTPTTSPYLLSLSGTYEGNGLKAVLAHERHKDYQAAGTLDKGTKINLVYTMDAWKFGFIYEWLDYEMTPGKHLRSGGFDISGSYTMGVHRFKALLGIRGDGTGDVKDGTQAKFIVKGPDTGGRQFNLGYDYILSKRTNLYAYYSILDNKKNAQFSYGVNGVTNPGAGSDLTAFAVGIRHLY